MGRVRYAKSMRDLERSEESDAGLLPGLHSTVHSIRCVYETDSEVTRAVVPKPLEASVASEVCVSFASVAMHVSPERSIDIRSASFGVRVDYDDKPGSYLLTMPMTSEQAVVAGRERYGEPKKIADIEFDGQGDEVAARVERMGIGFLAAKGTRVEEVDPRTQTEYGYCFKAYPSCTPGKGFDQDPQLVRLEWRHDYERVWRLEGELLLRDSPFDPVADLPVRRIVEFEYTEGRVVSSGRVLRPVPGDWLLPFIHQRYDEPAVEGIEV
jgi:acetoacetate decarboxylase